MCLSIKIDFDNSYVLFVNSTFEKTDTIYEVIIIRYNNRKQAKCLSS